MPDFQFNVDLAARHQLADELLSESPSLLHRLKLWNSDGASRNQAIYEALSQRLTCKASNYPENVVIGFIAQDRGTATRILHYYIHDLRRFIRDREVKDSSAAVETLYTEINNTSDPAARARLYDLVAIELQRKLLAQAEPDFAFRIVDPPAAPDMSYSPRLKLDCILAALFSGLSCMAWTLLWSGTDSTAKSVRSQTCNVRNSNKLTVITNKAWPTTRSPRRIK